MKQFVLFLIVLVALADLGEAMGICEQPRETGPCRASIRRYYYDSNVEECKVFIYGGCRGNSNNFHSKEACEKACGQPDCNASPLTGFCRAYIPSFYYDSKAGECKSFIYGGCGGNSNRFETKQACEKACGQPDCNASRLTGFCRAYIPSFYYDSKAGECKSFIYGGCGGNSNRFETKQACEKACGQPDCNASPLTGFCRAYIPSFYYDSKAGECKSFIYGGCGGNSNRFETKQECKKACGCNAPAATGLCRGNFPRYYYNSSNKKCERFVYGGCGGNSNNFNSKPECLKACL